MRPAYWVPPVAWMAVIFWLSSDTGSAEHTGTVLLPVLRWLWPALTPPQLDALHALVRKAAHLTEYAVLAALWYRAFTGGRRWSPGPAGWLALALSAGWALLDETHQGLVASRTSSVADVLVDTAGAVVALAAIQSGWRRRTTTVLLGIGAGGGAALLIVNALAGVPSGWLWLAVPAAAVVLAVRHHRQGPGVKPPTP